MNRIKSKKTIQIIFLCLAVIILCTFFSACGLTDASLNVKSIAIETNAKQIIYLPNEPISTTGLTLLVKYKDKSEEIIPVTKAMIRNEKAGVTAGEKNVNIYYAGFSVSYKVNTTMDMVFYLSSLLDNTIGTMTNEEEYSLDIAVANEKILVLREQTKYYVERGNGNTYWFLENKVYKHTILSEKILVTDTNEISSVAKHFLSNSIIQSMLNIYNAILDNDLESETATFKNLKIDFSMDGTKIIKCNYSSEILDSGDFTIKITDQNLVTYYQHNIKDGDLTTASVNYGNITVPNIIGNIEDYNKIS